VTEPKKPGAEFLRLHEERIAFIRQAAIAAMQSGPQRPEFCWSMARRLWETKPEDC
jgi:hypothetical protein